MWNPIYLKLENFRSHKDTTVAFKKNETTLIYGINLDDEGADSNGSGKSTIIEGITIALLDIIGKDLLQEEFIMDDENPCKLTIALDNAYLNSQLVIQRIYSRNKSEIVKIWENEVENKKLTSVSEANKRILELIGISREDLLDYFLINQENSGSFFKSSDGDKKRIIGRFTNSVMIRKAIEAIERDLSDIQFKYDENILRKVGVESKLEIYKQELIEERENKENKIKEQLAEQNDLLEEVKEELENLLENRRKTRDLCNKWNVDLYNISEQAGTEDQIEVLKNKLEKKKKKLKAVNQELDAARSIMLEQDKSIRDCIICPKCSAEFSLANPNMNVKKARKLIKECEEITIELEESAKDFELSVKTLKKQLNDSEEAKEELESLRRKHEIKSKELEFLHESIHVKKLSLDKIDKDIKQIKNQTLNKKKIEEFIVKINNQKLELETINNELTRLTEERNKISYWKIQFGISGFTTFLANKVLYLIEGHVNKYLRQFQVNLAVKINGYKVLKSGKVSEKITTLVGKNNMNFSSFKRFSGGQKQRINTCGILTLQKMINMTCKSGGLNLLCLDEYFEGLDSKGQESILRLLELSKITTLVVSHQNNDIEYPNKLVIKYKNKISTINKI